MDPAAVRDQIDRILRSQSFASKGQLRRLLKILSKNLDSQAVLKPHQVIQELWPSEARTKRAADVATEMNRLRHALESYYSYEGEADPITIVLPNRAPSTRDGNHEKRWIVAKARGGIEEPLTEPLANRRRGAKTLGMVIAASVLAVVAYLALRILAVPDQPRSARLDGTALTILDAEGRELWRKNFPDGFAGDWYYEKGLTARILFADLKDKGRTDVVFSYLPAANPRSTSSTLICYSDRGKERWRWMPGRQLPELEGSPATFQTVALGVVKATDKRPSRIVVSSNHDIWWPNQVAVLDGNGKTVSEYWHSGHLDYLVTADLDGDGREEIVAAGTSNGYHQATLVVLDPERVIGASTEAARPELQIHGMGAAQERLRALFPRSDLNQALFQFNQATEPTVEHGSIRLLVRERTVPPGWVIVYEFDKNFHLNAAFPAPDFISAHVEFYRNGKDAHSFSQEEQAQFQKVRCLVGCKTEYVPSNFH